MLAEQEEAGYGVILLDRNLAVLYANATARRIAERGDALLLTSGGLDAISPANQAALSRALAAARRQQVSGAVELARRFGGLPYVVHAYPVPSPDLLAGRASVAVAVRILDPDAVQDSGLAEAAAMLGLSAQETQVAVRLAAGADVVEISAALGLKSNTVRTYLAAIYRKTGTGRQGELVARLLRLSGFLEGTRK